MICGDRIQALAQGLQLGASCYMPIKEKFAIAEVRIPLKRRKTLDSAKVEDIAYDMLENGQTTPIRLRTDKGGGYILVEGYHRLEALRAIGESEVEGYLVHAQLH